MIQKKDRENSECNQNTPSRREFLQYAGLAVGGGTLLAAIPELSSLGAVKGAAAAVTSAPLPPHRAILVGGIHAYADQVSVAPGADINFHVSSDTPYTMQIYRLGTDPNTPNSDVSMSGSMPVSKPSQQPIYPGSYVYVDNRVAATASLRALTLECWVRPLLGLPSYTVAFNPADLLEVKMDFLPEPADWDQLQWHHIVATWDGTTKALWIDGMPQGTPQSFSGPIPAGPAPLRLAAFGTNGEASHFLNGDLAMPVIYNRALSPAEIQSRFQSRSAPQGVQPPALNGVLACWPLSEEQGADVADISPYGRPGRIINRKRGCGATPSAVDGDPSL
jgi:hypothetical protein